MVGFDMDSISVLESLVILCSPYMLTSIVNGTQTLF